MGTGELLEQRDAGVQQEIALDCRKGTKPAGQRKSDQPEAHAMSRTAVEPFTLV
jgi:hypothetical protein